MKSNRIIPRLPRKMVEEYRTNLCNYIRSMTYYKKMLDDELISAEEYSEIELMLLKKYQLSPKSLERMDLKSVAERDAWKSKK